MHAAVKLICAVVLVGTTSVCVNGNEVQPEGLSEAWRELSDFYSNEFNTLNLSVTEAGSRKVDGRLFSGERVIDTVFVAVDAQHWVLETKVVSQTSSDTIRRAEEDGRPVPAAGLGSAQASNAEYSFKVSEDDTGWALRSISTVVPVDGTKLRSGALYLPGTNIPIFTVLAEYGVFDLAEVRSEGDGILTLTMTPSDSPPSSIDFLGAQVAVGDISAQSVVVTVDSSRSWIPTSVVTKFTNRGEDATASMTIEYDESSFEYPVPASIVLKVQSNGLDTETKKSLVWESREIGDARFTLTHYGLPEPVVHSAGFGFMGALWAVTGIVCCITGVLLYRGRGHANA